MFVRDKPPVPRGETWFRRGGMTLMGDGGVGVGTSPTETRSPRKSPQCEERESETTTEKPQLLWLRSTGIPREDPRVEKSRYLTNGSLIFSHRPGPPLGV